MSENELPNQNSNCSEQPMDYLNKAAEACAAGDLTLGLHLYLAAYEKATSDPGSSTGMAVAALREAWHLACDLKERSMAEHVFEKLEPYLSGDEISECAMTLQNLALDRLEEYGFSREELQDMAEAISQDFLGVDGSVVKVEHITIPNAGMFGVPNQIVADVEVEIDRSPEPAIDEPAPAGQAVLSPEAQGEAPDVPEASGKPDKPKSDTVNPQMGVADTFNPYDMFPPSSEGTSWRSATNIGSGWSGSVGLDGTTVLDKRFEGFSPVIKHDGETEAPAESDAPVEQDAAGQQDERAQASAAAPAPAEGGQVASSGAPAQPKAQAAKQPKTGEALSKGTAANQSGETIMPSMPEVAVVGESAFNYASLKGYDEAVSIMRDYGFGLQHDAGFSSFVDMLNKQHGLTRMPAADTMLFRAPAIEDATRFVEATIGELGLPSLRMAIEDSGQGMPMLCVTTDSSNRPRMNRQQNRFQGPAVLVIEDLSLWRTPEVPENVEGGVQAFVMANVSRAARETFNMIRASIEDPDVVVLATSSMDGEVEPVFYDMLEPLTIIDIGNPTENERQAIWTEIMSKHPSTRGLDLQDLVRFSAGMARYDIYMAAREAIEEAYKFGLVQRGFVPVTAQNMLDKLAACQPFDSEEYHALEEKVISEFSNGLDDLEQLLGGPQG